MFSVESVPTPKRHGSHRALFNQLDKIRQCLAPVSKFSVFYTCVPFLKVFPPQTLFNVFGLCCYGARLDIDYEGIIHPGVALLCSRNKQGLQHFYRMRINNRLIAHANVSLSMSIFHGVTVCSGKVLFDS